MLEVPLKQAYTRREARRVLGISEGQLRSWERQELLAPLEIFAFSDLIALRTLQKLRKNRVPTERIRRAMTAIREKLATAGDPLRELKLFSEGRRVAVLVDGKKMEPVSGQLLLDFDKEELRQLLSFPRTPGTSNQDREKEAEFWFQKGLELEQIGAPVAQIVEAYERATSLDPRSAGALVNLGTVHYHLRTWDKAEAYYKQALEADPTYALAHFNLGNLYDEKGKRGLALSHYEAAVSLNPEYADAHYNLALLCQSQGDLMRALRHWRIYLKLDPSSSWAAIARREMDKLRRAAVVEGASVRSAARAGEE